MTKTNMDLSELLAKHDKGDLLRGIAEAGPAPVLFRSRAHVRRPFVRRPLVISSRGLNVSGAGCRSR